MIAAGPCAAAPPVPSCGRRFSAMTRRVFSRPLWERTPLSRQAARFEHPCAERLIAIA